MGSYKRAVRSKSLVDCAYCNKPFLKEDYEIYRASKINSNHFCSSICVGFWTVRANFGAAAGFHYYASCCRKRARLKGFGFDVSPEFLRDLYSEQKGICQLSGLQMILNSPSNGLLKSPYYASLDRIDESKGYLKGNLHFVALALNYMRNSFSMDEAVAFISELRCPTLGLPYVDKGFFFYTRSCRIRAARRNLDFCLDTNFFSDLFFSQGGRCALSGLPMFLNNFRKKRVHKSLYYASVDRLDAAFGYIPGNVQFVCLGMNYMRNSFTIDETKEFLCRLRV